ncbi:elongation factor P maturation arginine rhamnosyltransferase EarP [Undibacterium sp. Di24W]|uniref:elongation factor P maturation arginine rhamnosyltransferase EarP n=1 Tax=Undibacterium sp. Di24W TaxID=3413033 RepID=UPI003BF131F6
MPVNRIAVTSLVLFCKVVDNYGDIGICWRLARQLNNEHGIQVHLWVDDLLSFQRICPQVKTDLDLQTIEGVRVQNWCNQDGIYAKETIADIVIEFFACDIPSGYISAMAQCDRAPIWINLEGLTAEEWVEGCHTLPSPHPSLPLTKYFFFPGFNARTGGLIHERSLDQQRRDFLAAEQTRTNFLGQLGVLPEEMQSLKISLFCYPHAPVAELFTAWTHHPLPVLCLVPEGVASETLKHFFGTAPTAGKHYQQGALTVRVIPFMPQADYDKLLWSCDVNFVRGEDSFVRAQWAAKPFIWHIYPQDENLHHKKLKAFLQTHLATTDSSRALSLSWNGGLAGHDCSNLWSDLNADLSAIEVLSIEWLARMNAVGDLASNLLSFANTKR